jgi:hypothetical protein
MHKNFFFNQYYKLWLEDDIFHVTVYAEEFTLEMATEGVRQRMIICGNETYPMLSDCRRVKYFDLAARKYFATPQSTVCLSAGALLITSQLQKVIGNFFLKVNRPPIPGQLFTSETEAKAWLEQYKVRLPATQPATNHP